jgi:hypothetical protein
MLPRRSFWGEHGEHRSEPPRRRHASTALTHATGDRPTAHAEDITTKIPITSADTLILTDEERERFTPYCRLPEFNEGYTDASLGRWNAGNFYAGLGATCWFLGAECWVRRQRAKRARAEFESLFAQGACGDDDNFAPDDAA